MPHTYRSKALMRRAARYGRETLRDTLALLFPMRHWIGSLRPHTLLADLQAGITGTALVLPQGIAFAMIAGLPPEFGLYSAIFVQIIAGFFGSSLHMVSGPTVALSIVIPGIVAQYAAIGSPQYIQIAMMLMLMVGIIQLVFALFRMGVLVNFISHTVILGFTAGAATLIIIQQLDTYFGLDFPPGISIAEIFQHFQKELVTLNPASLFIASVSLLATALVRRWRRHAPHMLTGIVVGAVVCWAIGGPDRGVAMLGTLPAGLPQFTLPHFDWILAQNMLPSALALALLGLIEAASISRAIAVRSHQHIDSNQEFFGQGLSNLLGSFASCYVGSGSFTRSGVNYDAGAKTPFSLLFCSLIVVAVVSFIPQITRFLPLPAMAAVIIMAGFNLFDFKEIRNIAHTSRSELSVIIVTFLATLLINLEFAIYIGVILSLVHYLKKTAHPKVSAVVPDRNDPYRHMRDLYRDSIECPQLHIVRLDGSIYFGAVDHVNQRLSELFAGQQHRDLLIVCEGVNFIDIAGITALLQIKAQLRKQHHELYLAALKPQVRAFIKRGPYWREFEGDDHLFDSTYAAIRNICQKFDHDICAACEKRIFDECSKLPNTQQDRQQARSKHFS